MKRGTDLKIKFVLLSNDLGLSKWETKGLLQALWDLTAENAQDGGIGRFTDVEIAAGIGWPLDRADEMINALVDRAWFDDDSTHRLVVHNWHKHCEDWVKKRIKRSADHDAKANTATPEPKRRITSDNGGQRPTTPDETRLPVPGPEPVTSNQEPEPEIKSAPKPRVVRSLREKRVPFPPDGLSDSELSELRSWAAAPPQHPARPFPWPDVEAKVEGIRLWAEADDHRRVNWVRTIQAAVRKDCAAGGRARASPRRHQPGPLEIAGQNALHRRGLLDVQH